MTRGSNGCRRLCALAGLALAAALLPSCSAGPVPVLACQPGWHLLIRPAGARASEELFGVSIVANDDVWAVGVTVRPRSPARTLVEHWHEGAWRTVPSPDRGSGGSFLNAVVALSASNAWAVGLSRSPGGRARTLIEHWNGRRWAITASPDAGPGDNSLVSVAASSSRDVWAVGYRGARPAYRSLAEHWDGRRWTIARLPRLAGHGDGLNAVDVTASGVVWAVGGSAGGRGPSQPLVLRLRDSSWSDISAPASLRAATLNGVVALGRSEAWAVGATRSGGGDRAYGLVTDGPRWRVIPVDLPGAVSIDLNAAWAAGTSDVWAVGSSFDGRWYRPLITRGGAAAGNLSSIPTPHIPGHDSRLMAVDGLAGGELWAVGSTARSGGPQRVLILRRCVGSSS